MATTCLFSDLPTNWLYRLGFAPCKDFGSTNIIGPKQMFKKNWGSENNSCLKKFLESNKILPKKIMALKKLGPKSVDKIGSVTAEILLIWTHVAMAYVD